MKLILNCFSSNQFEISKADYKWICFLLIVYIYGKWVEEIYKSIKEKEDAKEKKESDEKIAKINKKVANIAEIEEGKKTKEGKYRIWKNGGLISLLQNCQCAYLNM